MLTLTTDEGGREINAAMANLGGSRYVGKDDRISQASPCSSCTLFLGPFIS